MFKKEEKVEQASETTVKLDKEQLLKLAELVLYVKNNNMVFSKPPNGQIHRVTAEELLKRFNLV